MQEMYKIDINGTVRRMTEEEQAAFVPAVESEPTAEERIAALEKRNEELMTMLEKLVSEGAP